MQREAVSVSGPAGRLEAMLEGPARPVATAVVCHPHPLFRGTMYNKVAYTLARAAAQSGAATLRFNFRGVGASEGTFDHGNGELEDCLAAERWLRERHPGLACWRLGFSFGAAMVLKASLGERCEVLVTVAPPADRFAEYSLDGAAPEVDHWLLAQGDGDEVVSAPAALAWARGLDRPPEVAVFEGVGHFFHGSLTALRRRVCATLSRVNEERC